MNRCIEVALVVGLALSVCSCGSREEPVREAIFKQRETVDTLYLMDDGREIIAPGNMDGAIVDAETGKPAWAAYTCDNPNCPGEGNSGRPYLFTWPQPYAYVTEDGAIGYRQPDDEQEALRLLEEYAEIACPACEKIRKRDKETAQQWQQYSQWVHPYVLPESAKQLEELDEAYRNLMKKGNGGDD